MQPDKFCESEFIDLSKRRCYNEKDASKKPHINRILSIFYVTNSTVDKTLTADPNFKE